MNLFLLFALLTLHYSKSDPTTQKSEELAHNELRIEDIQTSTRMQNGIVIVPIANVNEDIISLERSVIRFLINHHYIVEDFIYQWERLKRRHLLNQDDQSKILINEATIYKAIKKYQEDNALAQTGIMDMNILKKVFGNKYSGISMIDAGGVYFLENIKTYGEDDPNIGKALRFQTSPQRKKRSLLRMPSREENTSDEVVSHVDKKKSNDL
ncbi:MAG: hypothetical protein ACRCZ0_05730 [Cetobacterium sp.]